MVIWIVSAEKVLPLGRQEVLLSPSSARWQPMVATLPAECHPLHRSQPDDGHAAAGVFQPPFAGIATGTVHAVSL